MGTVTRKTRDGVVEWQCSCCGDFFPREGFVRDGQRQTICNLCALAEEREALVKTLPLYKHIHGSMPRAKKDIDAAIWRTVKPFTPGIKKGINFGGKRGPESFQGKKTSILKLISSRRRKLPEIYHDPLTSLVGSITFPPKAALWLAFRPGVLSIQAFRLFAIQCAEHAAEDTGLFTHFSELSDIFVQVWDVAASRIGTLQESRVKTHEVQSRIERMPHTDEMLLAGAALVAMCFPDSKSAALIASNRYFEILLTKENEKEAWEYLSFALREAVSKEARIKLEEESGRDA